MIEVTQDAGLWRVVLNRPDKANALAFGLVDEVVAPDALDARVRALAADALAAEPGHIAAIKALVG